MPVQFHYAPEMRDRFPTLRSAALYAEGVDGLAPDGTATETLKATLTARADQRLAVCAEGDLPEIQAWRRAFSAMGLKPTQYRCAAEALLRRYRKQGALPRLHPLIDLCNAASLAFAIPVAAFDLDPIAQPLTVRPARGDETYDDLAGTSERPEPGEIIFADAAGRAHARRWTHRQSGRSAVHAGTRRVLIVAEALHATAADDVAALMAVLRDGLSAIGPAGRLHAVVPQ